MQRSIGGAMLDALFFRVPKKSPPSSMKAVPPASGAIRHTANFEAVQLNQRTAQGGSHLT